MGRGQPHDIIIFQMWNTAKFGNSKLEKLILYVFAEKWFLDLGVIFFSCYLCNYNVHVEQTWIWLKTNARVPYLTDYLFSAICLAGNNWVWQFMG